MVAHGNNLAGIHIVLDAEFTGGNDALCLVADIEKDLVTVDLDDDSFDNVAIVEVLDGGIDCCHEVFGGADVIDGDDLGTCSGGSGHGR